MSKELFLIRHSLAQEAFRGQADIERELTETGSIRAMQLGNYLHGRGVQADILFSSMANRARRTAELVSEKVLSNNLEVIYHEDLYESSVRLMLSLINSLDNSFGKVVMIGHNPILPYTVEYLTGTIADELEPGGVMHLRASTDNWAEVSGKTMELVEYISPEAYIAKSE